jgi:uncharacterized protein (TIGR04255 family)
MGTKMKNAPVYFTIAQVRHNPILNLSSYAPTIQDRMRKAGYPDHRPGKTLIINLTSNAPDGQSDMQPAIPQAVERHMFLNMDGTRGFIVEQGALSFQTTEYDTFQTLSEQFFVGLVIVHECIGLSYTERVGIRYLDAVVPTGADDDLRDYLAPGVLGLAGRLPDGVAIGLSLSETHIPLPDANLLSRTIVRSGALGFPMDLEPQGLRVPARFERVNGLHAIIDTDASQLGRQVFDIDQLRGRLDMLHMRIRMAFDASVTKHALKVWQ